MIYSYQQKNKFKHLLLDRNIVRLKNLYPATIQRYQDQIRWIKENIGEHNITWTVNYGFIYKGKKIYEKDVDSQNFRNTNRWKETEYVVQWSFLNNDDALAYMLRWS